jgi:hypothetical protein
LVVETSEDGESCLEVAREENKKQLNGSKLTGIFTVADGRQWRFIRLVRIGRNHSGNDRLRTAAREIFGGVPE